MKTRRELSPQSPKGKNFDLKSCQTFLEHTELQYTNFESKINPKTLNFKNPLTEKVYREYFDTNCSKSHMNLLMIILIEVANTVVELIYLGYNYTIIIQYTFIIFLIIKGASLVTETLVFFHHKIPYMINFPDFAILIGISIADMGIVLIAHTRSNSNIIEMTQFICIGKAAQYFLALYSRPKRFLPVLITFIICFLLFIYSLNNSLFKIMDYRFVKSCVIIAMLAFFSILTYYVNKNSRSSFYNLYILWQDLNNQKQIIKNMPIPLIVSSKQNISFINNLSIDLFNLNESLNIEDQLENMNIISEPKFKEISLNEYLRISKINSPKAILKIKLDEITKEIEAVKIPFKFNGKKNFINVFKDLTEIFFQEKQKLQKKFELIMIGSMTHNFRTPLNYILGASEMALEIYNEIPPALKESMTRIYHQSLILFDLIDYIHEYFYFKNNKLVRVEESFNPKEVVESVIKLYEEGLTHKEIKLKFKFETNIPKFISNDKKKYRQILVALITNSIKFTSKGEIVIELKYEENTSHLHTSIEDTGIGIPPDKLQTIIDGFSQVEIDHLEGRECLGMGFGIPLSNAFCQIMGGIQINIISKEKEGTKVAFDIKHYSNSSYRVIKVEPKESNNSLFKTSQTTSKMDNNYLADFNNKISILGSCSNFKFLLVDDIDSNICVLQSYCKRLNIQYDVAYNGAEAIELFKKSMEKRTNTYYQMILMDINMPIMDGIEASKRIREMDKDCTSKTIIIGITANMEFSIRDDAKHSKMNELREKPFSYTDFLKIIKHYLDL